MSDEKLFQDTNTVTEVPVTSASPKRTIIILILVIMALGVLRLLFSRIPSFRRQEAAGVLATATPLPRTQTFVDALRGTLLFFRDAALVEVSFPSRTEKTILGVGSENIADSLPAFSPVWSKDGTYVALLSPSMELIVSTYTSGEFVLSIPLTLSDIKPTGLSVSFSPDSSAIVVHEQTDRSSSLRFYDLTTKQLLGSYPNCSSTGAWVNLGYMGVCMLADTQSLVRIQFTQESSSMVTLITNLRAKQLQLVSGLDETRVLMVKGIGQARTYISVTDSGKQAPVTAAYLKQLPPIDFMLNPKQQFLKKIEQQTGKTGVVDVSTDTANSWIVFENHEGLWIVDLAMKETPYFLGAGTHPSIRPE